MQVMQVAVLLLFVSGFYPLGRAWLGSRRTSLWQALHWALAAWLAWTGVALLGVLADETARLAHLRYVALCLTGCVGVAVLGARRPGVHAWNFVVLSLLAVMLLPLAENLLPGAPLLDTLRLVFLAGTLSVGMLNYVPTRVGPATVLVGLGCVLEMLSLVQPAGFVAGLGGSGSLGWFCLGLAPWTGWAAWHTASVPPAEFARLWWDFRSRYGWLWAQRVREQFNNAAHHAGWPVRLFWDGLVVIDTVGPPGEEADREMLATLQGLLKRFLGEDSAVG